MRPGKCEMKDDENRKKLTQRVGGRAGKATVRDQHKMPHERM